MAEELREPSANAAVGRIDVVNWEEAGSNKRLRRLIANTPFANEVETME